MEKMTDGEACSDPSEGAPNADGTELAVGMRDVAEDDHGRESPDGSGGELLELENTEDKAAMPMVSDSVECEGDED